MTYSSKIVEATEPFAQPQRSLVPEDVKPEACRRLGCKMTLFREGVVCDEDGEIAFSPLHEDSVAFVHIHAGHMDTLRISMAWLMDVDKDLWAEIVPWLESLHEPQAR